MNENWRGCRFRVENSNWCTAAELTPNVMGKIDIVNDEVFSCEKIRKIGLCPVTQGFTGLRNLSPDELRSLVDDFKLNI